MQLDMCISVALPDAVCAHATLIKSARPCVREGDN